MKMVFRILELAHQCVPDNFLRTASFLMPFVSMSSMCGFHESQVSNFTRRKVGVSTWGSVLSPSFMVTFSCPTYRLGSSPKEKPVSKLMTVILMKGMSKLLTVIMMEGMSRLIAVVLMKEMSNSSL